MNKQLFVCLLVISVVFMATSVRADYLDVFANGTVKSWQNITVFSTVFMNNGTPVQNVNVSFNFTTANLTQNTTGSGTYNTTLAVPPGRTGEFNITIWFNNSNKTIPVFITNISTGSVNFPGLKPPFSSGESFLVNVSIFNLTNQTLQNYTPAIEMFLSNGPKAAWTIANTTRKDVHQGNITYNVTIPSTADGGVYGVSVDRGAIISYFYVKSGFSVAANTQTEKNETRVDYTPGSNFTILVKFRDASDNPIVNATNVTATVKYPNGSTSTLQLFHDANRDGFYNTTFITNSGQSGQYSIEVTAQNGSTKVQTSTIVNTQMLKARLEPQTGLFQEWGDAAAFATNSPAALNFLVTNLSDDSIVQGATSGGASRVNCNSIIVASATNANNGSAVTINAASDASGTYFSTPVCRMTFTTPNETGTYKFSVNATVGTSTINTSVSGIGYMTVQKYFLRAAPVSSLGGFASFVSQFEPSGNATFQVFAFDMATGAEVSGDNVTNVTAVKIKPLDFGGGTSEITNITTENITAGTSASAPTITIRLPANRTGPQLIEITARINGTNETVVGTAFYFTKYIMGWLSPDSGATFFEGGGSQGGSQGGGPSGGYGPGGAFSCSPGKKIFSGNVFEVKANGAAENVEVTNITFAREELTGKNIKSCLSITSNKSDSSGRISIPVTISSSCGSLSGFYFVQFNATYKGNLDTLESGFSCRTFNFYPSASAWRVDSRGSVNITINGITRLNDSRNMQNGTMRIINAINWNPTGGKALSLNGTINASVTNGIGVIVLNPTNLSVDKWPEGSINLNVEFTAKASEGGGSDVQYSGFQSIPFDVYVKQVGNNSNVWGQTFRPGDLVTVRLSAATNISRENYDTNRSIIPVARGFKVKVGVPWEGRLVDVTPSSAVLIYDNWNHTTQSGYPTYGEEFWELNFTLPSKLKKGWNQVEITVNNSAGDKASTNVGFEISYFTVRTGVVESVSAFSANTNTAGVNATLNSSGIAYDNITQHYNVRSKSGIVCYNTQFNVQRFSESGSQVVYNSTDRILVLDNTSSGVYDTVVWNSSGVITITQQFQNKSNIYIYNFENCNNFNVINASYTPSWSSYFDTFETNSNFTIPYIIRNASSGAPPTAGATVSINSLIKQNDGSGLGGGMGFDTKLSSSEYATVSAATNAHGIAFVKLNITRSGSYQLFWKVTQGSIEDVAKFYTGFGFGGGYADFGTQVSVRSFSAYGQRTQRLGSNTANIVLTLGPNNISTSLNIYNYTNLSSRVTLWNGTLNETVSGALRADYANSVFYVIYDPLTNKTIIDDDPDMNVTTNDNTGSDYMAHTNASINSSIALGTGYTLKVSKIEVNKTNSNVTKIAVFQTSPSPGWIEVNATTNYTISVCAQGFAKPNPPYEGVSVYLYGESWSYSFGGPSTFNTTPLQWHDPINGTRFSFSEVNATTGPSGCVALDVTYPGGWPQGSTTIRGTLTRNSDRETVWVDSVWRQYNSWPS